MAGTRAFGQVSGYSGTTSSSHNPFALAPDKVYGNNASNSSHSPFVPNPFGPVTSPYFFTQGSSFGSSTGVFGSQSSFSPASSSTFLFGQGSYSSASQSIFKNTRNSGHNAFASTTVESATISSPAKQNFSFGGTLTGSFGASSSSFLTSPATCGSQINSYKPTSAKEGFNCKLISISAMPSYESKSHEELRWEEYELKYRGKQNSISNPVNRQQFNFSLPPITSSSGILSPPYITPAFSKNINTTAFPLPCISSPDPSPIFSSLYTRTPELTSSKSTFSVPPKDCSVSLAAAPSLRSWCNSSIQLLQNSQLPSLSTKLWPSHSTASTVSGCDQVTASNSAFPPTMPCARNENLVSHINQAPSQFTAPLVPEVTAENNRGVLLDVGEDKPFLPRQLSATETVKVVGSIIVAKDPFGSECSISQPSPGHSACSLVHYGISSIPVPNKPTRTTVSSFLTSSRHTSLKPLTVNVRRYRPSSNGPKAEGIECTSRACGYMVPRENPKSVFAASPELSHVNTSKEEASPIHHASAVEYEDGTDSAKKDHLSSSTLNSLNSLNDHFAEADNNTIQIDKISIPKLQRSDYYTEPKIETLVSIESFNPGYWSHVQDFIVGRYGYGWVKFYGETDVRGLDLDSLIHFNNREVIVYGEDIDKPPVGQGLNKAAEVTLQNIKCIDKSGKQYTRGKMVDKFIEKLKKVAARQGAEFVSYDPVNGEWRFCVQHF